MAPSPRRPRSLGRLLRDVQRPLYVIDAERRLAYANDACLQWWGRTTGEGLLGRECRYGDTSEPLLAAISPPPGAYEGDVEFRSVVIPETMDRAARSVQFTPLDDPPAPAVLAVADCPPPAPPSVAGLDVRALEDQLRRLRRSDPSVDALVPLIGSSEVAARTRRRVRVAATSTDHVCLLGPPASGYEAVARHLHHAGGDAGPLIPIDGAIVDAELLDSAVGAAVARLAADARNRAALLIRDADRLAGDAAGRLEQLVMQYDTRLRCFSAARTPLDELAGFPRRLAMLLSTTVVELPPLADRAEDVPLVAQSLLDRRVAAGARTAGFTRPAMDRLVLYPWPGDFEELNAAVRHAARECPAGMITPNHLPLAIRTYRIDEPSRAAADEPIALDAFLARVEGELIARALDRAGGNRTEAARRLGISRARLLRRLSELSPEES